MTRGRDRFAPAERASGEEAGLTEAPPVVEMLEISKAYLGVLAVDHADLTLRPGEILGLVGKNGAGKSTLIKVLAGAVPLDAGEIRVDGRPVHIHGAPDSQALGIAVIHQELNDVPGMSVAENIGLGLHYPKHAGVLVNWRRLRRLASETLARLGETGIRPEAPVGTLSVAHQRMVMIARALYARARVIVLDEPTGSLSAEEVAHLHEVVRSLAAQGVGIVYVTHRLSEIFELTHRVVVMRDGRVVDERPTAGFDARSLIAAITGEEEAETADERRGRLLARRRRGEELLRIEGLSAGPVEDVGFSVHAGEVLGLAGLVGAGRTELARAVFGADPREAGRVLVAGRERSMRSPRQALRAGVALLPEDRRHQGLVRGFSVRKNVTLGSLRQFRAGALPVPSRRRERAVARGLIERLRIKTRGPEEPVAYLSGGGQQKVVLAKWLASARTRVLIFDEPTLGIDVETKNEIYELMSELAEEGRAVLFISSEFSELVQACDRVLVMREGRIVAELAGADVTERAIVERCYAAPAGAGDGGT
jgi:ribose transport system ATP-binding protein